ncbi:MAG: DUF427 domain-containing protein [Bacteroidota bacterium]
MKNRIKPKAGQESVWDYPRPPRLEPSTKHIKVYWQDQLIAESNQAYRILETSHPPVYYLPPTAIVNSRVKASNHRQTFCEWKGQAVYWDIVDLQGEIVSAAAAWSYPGPNARYSAIRDYLAFYPSRVTACYVNDEAVQAQAGDFYGGWITKDIVGPFKGEPGTWGW